MTGKILLWLLATGLLIPVFLAEAQQPTKIARIGVLRPGALPDAEFEAFRQGLRELGYIEGKNIIIEPRFAEGKVERLRDLVAELIQIKVDIIVTPGAPQTRAAKEATSTIPIVMVNVGNPVGAGLVTSLAKPGGNVTGLTTITTDLRGKRLELLKEAVPKLLRLAVLWNPDAPAGREETEIAAPLLGLKLQLLEVRGPQDLDGAFRAAVKERSQALVVPRNPVVFAERKRVADLAIKSRLPAIYDEKEFAEAGGLMSYGTNIVDLNRRAAVYVDKILKGTKPADLPVEQPTKFELVINLKTAKQIGLTIPPNVLARADKVIR
jgi:putative tryptophan/tyrosine transport system substrate-binding protein